MTNPSDAPDALFSFRHDSYALKGASESFEKDDFLQMCADTFLYRPQLLAAGGLLGVSICFHRHFLIRTCSIFILVYNECSSI